MTYKEAQEDIAQKRDKVFSLAAGQAPPRDVLGFLIAPMSIYSDNNLREYLMNECITKGEDNEMALHEVAPNAALTGQLNPFVIIRMRGQNIAIDMNGYLTGGNDIIEDGKA